MDKELEVIIKRYLDTERKQKIFGVRTQPLIDRFEDIPFSISRSNWGGIALSSLHELGGYVDLRGICKLCEIGNLVLNRIPMIIMDESAVVMYETDYNELDVKIDTKSKDLIMVMDMGGKVWLKKGKLSGGFYMDMENLTGQYNIAVGTLLFDRKLNKLGLSDNERRIFTFNNGEVTIETL